MLIYIVLLVYLFERSQVEGGWNCVSCDSLENSCSGKFEYTKSKSKVGWLKFVVVHAQYAAIFFLFALGIHRFSELSLHQ